MRQERDRYPRVVPRANRKKHGIFIVTRLGYEWQSVKVKLWFLHDFVVWKR